MAGTAKQYELLFQLTARLGPNFSQSFKNASKTMQTMQTDLKNADQKLKDVSAYQKQQNAVAKSKERVSELQAEHQRLVEEIEATGEATPELTKKLQANEKALQKAKDATATAEEKLGKLSDTLKEAGVNTNNLDKETGELKEQYDKLQKSQEKVQALTEKQAATKQAISQTKGQLVGLVGTVTAIGAAIYAGPVKNAMKWQQQMRNVATLLDGDVKGRIAELNKNVMALSNSTGIGTSDLTDGLYQVVSAFGDSADAAKQLEIAAKAAKAGNATTTDSINLLSAVTKGYGDTSAEAQQKAADLAFQTVKLGQTSFPELASSIGAVIPLASTLGTKQEDLFGAMATLTGVTGGTAEVTTQLKATMKSFLSPSKDMQKSLESMGYESGKALLESEGLQGALEKLKGSVGGDELAFAKLFSSVEAQNAVLALAGNQADNFTEKTKQMYEATGAAQKAFETATDSTEARTQKAKNSIMNLGTVLGDMLLPYVGQAAEKVADLAAKVSDFAQKNPEVIKTVAKIAAGLVGLKAGGLVAKLGFLNVQNGFFGLQKEFAKLSGLGITKYLGSLGGAFSGIPGAGKGILSYFKNVGGAAKGVTTAFSGVLNQSTIFTKISSVISGVGGKAGSLFTTMGGNLLTKLIQPFSLLGGKLGGVLSGIGGIITRSPIGKIGGLIGAGFGKITTFLAPVGNAVKTMLGPIGKLASTALGPLGGIAGKILPIVGIVTTVITVFKLLQNHLQEIRKFIQKTFGDEALAVFDKVVAVITNVGNVIKGIFSGGNIGEARNKIQEIFGDKGTKVFDTLVNVLGTVRKAVANVIQFVTDNVVPVAEQVLQVIITRVIPGIVSFIKAAAPTIMQIIQSVVDFVGEAIPIIASFIAGLMPVISDVITFIQTYVLPIISRVFSFLTGTVMPAISAAIQAILPVVINVLSILLPAIQTALTTIWNIVVPIIQGILAVVQAVLPVILAVVQSVIGSISGVIQNLMTILQGIISFVTGVFTGNWSQAWEGIKSIFSGAVGGLGEIIKAPLRVVISAVNTVIRGLNKLKVPDWVPGLGGKGINIPEIPGFAKGTDRTPSTFIAGENGPELITNAANRKVFTAAQTGQIFNNAVKAENINTANGVNASLGGAGTITLQVTNSPTVVVQGGDTNGIKEQLAQYDEEFLEKLREIIRQILKEQKEQEGRVAYA